MSGTPTRFIAIVRGGTFEEKNTLTKDFYVPHREFLGKSRRPASIANVIAVSFFQASEAFACVGSVNGSVVNDIRRRLANAIRTRNLTYFYPNAIPNAVLH